MTIHPPQIALHGGPEPWPLAGHLRGSLSSESVAVSWAGRVGARDPEVGWRTSRTVDAALRAGGTPRGDRRRVLAVLWSRLEGLELPALGILLASRDAHGVALSAVGLTRIYGLRQGGFATWLHGSHPLLGAPGLPDELPGALVSDAVPDWLVGVTVDADRVDLDGVAAERVFPRCGVHG